MTLKAKRRLVMQAVGFTEKRVEEHGDGIFSYKRGGVLLKAELVHVLDALGIASEAVSSGNHTVRALRACIRAHLDGEGPGAASNYDHEPFTERELLDIRRVVADADAAVAEGCA